MIVLDTNVLSELMRPRPDHRVEAWLETQALAPLATTAVTVMEISRGLARLPAGARRADLEARFEALVAPGDGLPVLTFDEPASRLAGAYMARREALGRPAASADMMIAGIAGLARAILATRNGRDFEGLGLELVDPFAAAP